MRSDEYHEYIFQKLLFSEEAELALTTRINEIIKLRWVALGPRNYGKSIEWKLEGDPWDTEGNHYICTNNFTFMVVLCFLQ